MGGSTLNSFRTERRAIEVWNKVDRGFRVKGSRDPEEGSRQKKKIGASATHKQG